MKELPTEDIIIAIAFALILNEQEGLKPHGEISYFARKDMANFKNILIETSEDENNE